MEEIDPGLMLILMYVGGVILAAIVTVIYKACKKDPPDWQI